MTEADKQSLIKHQHYFAKQLEDVLGFDLQPVEYQQLAHRLMTVSIPLKEEPGSVLCGAFTAQQMTKLVALLKLFQTKQHSRNFRYAWDM